MNALLLIQSITFLSITFSLTIIPKQVMALTDISNYSYRVDTNFGTSFLQPFSETSIVSTIFAKGYTPTKDERAEEPKESDAKGAGAH